MAMARACDQDEEHPNPHRNSNPKTQNLHRCLTLLDDSPILFLSPLLLNIYDLDIRTLAAQNCPYFYSRLNAS
jgi:hypothetical protein